MVIEEDLKRVVRGSADLEERIDQLQKQKEILKAACKKSGARIQELENDREVLKKEIDRLFEENQNFETMLRSK
jgi:peptidoglycan hydrolase CwlO-like protein|tara:strand:+ start:419 stop:640 length:222 start_codon:yes stop_codon:yes gene_type:complete